MKRQRRCKRTHREPLEMTPPLTLEEQSRLIAECHGLAVALGLVKWELEPMKEKGT